MAAFDDFIGGLSQASNQNLQQNVLPGLRYGAQAAGGFGGTRQGIAEGVAAGNAQAGLAGQIGQLALGFGGLQNQALGQNQNFYTQQRGQDLQATALGASLYGAGTTGVLGQGQGLYDLGTTQQTAAWTPYQQANSLYSPYSGLGGSATSTQSGSTAGGALGGALAGAQLGKLWGGTNSMGNSTSASAWNTPATSWGFGTGGFGD